MAQPIWITENDLGTFVASTDISTYVVAKPVYPATQLTYQYFSGSLPLGLYITSNGFIKGTINALYVKTYTFAIQATDNLGNTSQRTFTMKVSLTPNQPTWVTTAGSLGVFPALVPVFVTLSATPNLPAVYVTYSLQSGTLPNGLSISENGIISGTPTLVTYETETKFTIRATDNFQNIRDRTFSITVSGSAIPEFTLPDGNILETFDSIWVELPITYNNPDINNPVTISVVEGILPPGLEINEYGLIRGYADPPITTVTLPSITTTATSTDTSNIITCYSTVGFVIGRTVKFSGTVIGGLQSNVIYYIKSIISPTEFTVSSTQYGSTVNLLSSSGLMSVTLPPTSTGQPTIRTYSFTLKLNSPLGSDTANYYINVINQNTPISQNGPGFLPNNRLPVILNTRPRTYDIPQSDLYYGYYVLDNGSKGYTYATSYPAPMGDFDSDNYFSFKIIGLDFDNNEIKYQFANLPNWLTGDTNTGWVTGTPSLGTKNASQFSFSVSVYKVRNPSLMSSFFTFSVNILKDIKNVVTWITDSDLGTLFNGSLSTINIEAIADVDLKYRIINGNLPSNLALATNGEIMGFVGFQPTTEILYKGDTSNFNFTIEAYSDEYQLIRSTKTFNLTVLQEYAEPIENLYMKATPSLADRALIQSLLENETLIPNEMLYRPTDQNFGKATNVIYQHAYGIYASDLDQYVAAITKNHYWRNITLGEIETAIARTETGEILYEVVYSKIIDDLINPQGVSVNSQVNWPRLIDLGSGPWYTSVTDIYTSFETVLNQNYFASLTPGYTNVLYPNSLPNMRNRVGEVLGQEYDFRILPSWMTSQQENGSTLGYTQAWVICYTKPGFSKIIKNNIETKWLDNSGNINKLNRINFRLDKFSVNKSNTYDYNNSTSPPSWTELPSASPVPNPMNSKDFNVLFPRKTILPDRATYTQFNIFVGKKN